MLHLRQSQQSLGVVAHKAALAPGGAVFAVTGVVPGADFPLDHGLGGGVVVYDGEGFVYQFSEAHIVLS